VFFKNIFYHIFNTRTAAGIPLTKEEICGFLVFPLCWIDNPLYEWTLDFDFLGPKPTPETPELPPVSFLEIIYCLEIRN